MLKLKLPQFLFTHYKVLKISDDASQLQIKNSYLELVKKHHPDVGEISPQEFVKVRQAYETLKDPELRRAYDRQLALELRNSGQSKNGYYSKNEQDDFFQKTSERSINIKSIISGVLNLAVLATFLYVLDNHFRPSMTQHQIRRQNIFLANENIDSSPSAQQARRKQYAKEMKDKKFTAQVVQMKVNNGSQLTTRAKNNKKTCIESIPGISKENNSGRNLEAEKEEYM